MASISSRSDYNQAVKFLNGKLSAEKLIAWSALAIVRAEYVPVNCGVYFVNLWGASHKMLAADGATSDTLNFWHSALMHADKNTRLKLTESGTDCLLDIARVRSTNRFSSVVGRTMTDKSKRFRPICRRCQILYCTPV